MNRQKLIKLGIASGLVAVAYISLVATIMSFGQAIAIGRFMNPAFGIMVFLMIFVFSAAVMFMALLGRPIMLYMDGHKKEALFLLAWTLSSFLVIGILMAAILSIFR
jgi:hypothetical protein